MSGLHSLLRYLVFVVGLATMGYALYGLLARRSFDETMRKLGSAFALTLYLQILIGVGMLFTGSFDPAATGHVFMMLFAAAVATVVPSVMKRRPVEERTHAPYLVATAVALALVGVGITGLGRPLFG